MNLFQSEQSPAKLVLELDELVGHYAITESPDENDLIKIKLNSNDGVWGVNYQPNVLLAQTIFHEILLAEFYRELVVAIGEGNYSEATTGQMLQALINNQDYILYDHIRRKKDWSHNFMANYYRDTIARATQEYVTGVAVPDNEQPDSLYMDLAWRGLRSDGEIDAWDELTELEQNTIDSTINSYIEENNNQTCTE